MNMQSSVLFMLLVVSQNMYAIKSDLNVFMGMYENEPYAEDAPQRWLIQQPVCSNAQTCACGAVTCCCGIGACLCPYLAVNGSFVEGVVIAALCCIGAYKSVGEGTRDVYLGKKRA